MSGRGSACFWQSFMVRTRYHRRSRGTATVGLHSGQPSNAVRAPIPGIDYSFPMRFVLGLDGGGTKTDMRQFECSASYGLPERDVQPWTSAPCYNEIFYTNRFVRNWGDSEDMWKQIVWHWMAAAKNNFRPDRKCPFELFMILGPSRILAKERKPQRARPAGLRRCSRQTVRTCRGSSSKTQSLASRSQDPGRLMSFERLFQPNPSSHN